MEIETLQTETLQGKKKPLIKMELTNQELHVTHGVGVVKIFIYYYYFFLLDRCS